MLINSLWAPHASWEMLLHECTNAACYWRQMGWTPVSGCRCPAAMIDINFFPDYSMFGVCAWSWSSGGFCRGAPGQSTWAGGLLLGHLLSEILASPTSVAALHQARTSVQGQMRHLLQIWPPSTVDPVSIGSFSKFGVFLRFYANLRCKLKAWCGAQQDPSLKVVLHNDICARQALSVLSLLFSIIFIYFSSKAIRLLVFFPAATKNRNLAIQKTIKM